MSSPDDRDPSQKEALLSRGGSGDELLASISIQEDQKQHSRSPASLRFCLVLSCLLNVLLLVSISYMALTRATTPCVSYYANLPRNVVVENNHKSPFGPHNKNATDRVFHWERMSVSGAQVALDKGWAKEKGLPESSDFPWDKSKMIYSVRGYHTLHCLRQLHRWVTISVHNGTQVDRLTHVLHCLDSLRQDALCEADDTPMYSDGSSWGNGQKRVCRNFEALAQWSRDHHTCFLYVNETQGVDSMWNRYKWCPKGSPYSTVMRKYLGIPEDADMTIPSEMSSLPPYWENF